jgi:hypothetical protein
MALAVGGRPASNFRNNRPINGLTHLLVFHHCNLATKKTMSNDRTLVLSTVTANISDFIMGSSRSKIQVEWKLSVKPIDSAHCEYSNHVHAAATDEFLAFLKKNGITFERARAVNQALTDSHNREETPNFAKSIERRALLR